MPKLLVISDYRDSLNAVRPEGRWFVGLVRDHGYEVTLMTRRLGSSYLDELEAAGVRIIDWHPDSKFGKQDRDYIRKELDRGGYDLLHLFNNRANVAGIRAAKGWPGKVFTYRGYTGNIHWWDPSAYFQHLSPRVDRIVCVSPAVKESIDAVPFTDPQKTVVVAKGHDPAWYADVEPIDLHAEFDIPRGKLVVMIVANARRMKGMDYLGSSIGRLSPELPIHFLFAGRNLESQELVADLMDSPYPTDFTFAGHRADVLQLLKAADISLLPSVKGEGLSKVLLESFFLGKATIMTDIEGNRGLAIDGETALIVPARDEFALTAALERMVAEPGLRERLGPAARAYVGERYAADGYVAELDAVYRGAIRG